jgi:mannose-6-phosphate isomerase-like protein (cupin superfamily)
MNINLEEYIAKGNLEAFCLGNLSAEEEAQLQELCKRFPKLRVELQIVEQAMERLAAIAGVTPTIDHKKKLLDSLGFGNKRLDLNQLPVINEDTDYLDWLDALAHLLPAQPKDSIIFHPLTSTPELSQTLVFTRMSIPDETHEDLIESFFILEGNCTCIVGGQAYHLSPGDFLEIPLHVHHDIVLTSPYVRAILQQQPVIL